MSNKKQVKVSTGKMSDEQLKDRVHEILKHDQVSSISALGKIMGYSKISGSMTKRIRKLLPGIDELLAGNHALHSLDDKPVKKPGKTGGTSNVKGDKTNAKPVQVIPECPYRPTSAYAQVFQILFLNREQGISKPELLKKVVASGRPETTSRWNIAVVASPDAEGGGHRSSKANHYWVEKTPSGLLKLHLRS